MEAADDHRTLITVGTFDIVGCEQDDAGVPVFAIDAEIHAPFLHGLVPDDIGCPHITVDIVAVATPCRPLTGIESREVDFLSTFLDLLDDGRLKSC